MKYKSFMIGSLVTLIIIFISSIILIPFNKKELIYIKDVNDYSGKITKLKTSIKELEGSTCKKSLMNMLDRINETNFEDKVTIEEYYKSYYKDGIPFMKLYEEIITECKLEEKDEIYLKVLEHSVFPDSIKEKYLLSHELILKDYSSRDSLSKINTEKGTFITKTLELHILYDLINEVTYEED